MIFLYSAYSNSHHNPPPSGATIKILYIYFFYLFNNLNKSVKNKFILLSWSNILSGKLKLILNPISNKFLIYKIKKKSINYYKKLI